MQLYWALVLCLVKLHSDNRASAEMSPLVCVYTSVCVVFIRDAKEISLHFECEPCQQGCYHDKVHGCFSRCVHLTRLDRFVDAVRADFGCTARVIFTWDCCRTVFRSFWTAGMLSVIAKQCSCPIVLVVWYSFQTDCVCSYQTAGMICAWDCCQTVFCSLQTAMLVLVAKHFSVRTDQNTRAALCDYWTTYAELHSYQTVCSVIACCLIQFPNWFCLQLSNCWHDFCLRLLSNSLFQSPNCEHACSCCQTLQCSHWPKHSRCAVRLLNRLRWAPQLPNCLLCYCWLLPNSLLQFLNCEHACSCRTMQWLYCSRCLVHLPNCFGLYD